ncbi:MAG: hypothetical protein K8I65_01445 [Thermoanaerobaculia bacterium]|nr:hypothetical protein [Thermoanaerobaculia bacterium]
MALALVLALVALLIGSVRRPPVLDLPLLFEQAASFEAVLAGERPDLRIDWTGPNKLGVAFVLLARRLAGVEWAPRLALILLAAAWLGTVHALAARCRRPVATALLVSPLLFGSPFYAGFFNFLAGVPALLYWTWELEEPRRRRSPARIALSTLVGALLLYAAHVAWLQIGGFAIATFVLLHRFRWQELAARGAGVLPVLLLTHHWAGGWTAGDWQSGWGLVVAPLERVTSLGVAASFTLGGIRHAVEPALLLAALGWLVLAAARAIRERGAGVQPFLLTAGACFLTVAICGPEEVDKMVLVSSRWGGVGLACLLLALPAPKVNGNLLTALAASLVATHLVVTGSAWNQYERRVLAGFEEVLATVPEEARLFGVDLVRDYPPFRLPPVLQLYAWAAVERGARIESTFADPGNNLLRWVDPASRRPLSEFFLWRPAFLRPGDLLGFTHVLVHAEPALASEWSSSLGVLRSGPTAGTWSLFEVAAASDGDRVGENEHRAAANGES